MTIEPLSRRHRAAEIILTSATSCASIIESLDVQVYYQNDKDWYYRKEERRWVSMNDKSGWRKREVVNGEVRSSIFHIR